MNAPTSPQTAAQPRPARPSFWDITQDDLLLAAGFRPYSTACWPTSVFDWLLLNYKEKIYERCE